MHTPPAFGHARRAVPGPARLRVWARGGHRVCRARGFTLVEVLVALFIMAIMATLAWRGIDGLVRARDGVQGHAEHTLRLSAVVGQWEQDLAQLQRSVAAPPLRYDGAALRLTRRSPEGLRVVVWTLQDGALYRWASPPLTTVQDTQAAWARAQQWSTLQAQALRVLEGVATWQVYYYRTGDNAWSNAQSSAGTTPGSPGAAARPVTPPSAPAGASAPAPTDVEDDPDDDTLIPAGVRLVLNLPQGVLTRDLLLPPNP